MIHTIECMNEPKLDLDFLDQNTYRFNRSYYLALVRSEGDGTVTMRAIDDDPNMHDTIKKEGYPERAKQIREYYRKKIIPSVHLMVCL